MKLSAPPPLFRLTLLLAIASLVVSVGGGVVMERRYADATRWVQHTAAVRLAVAGARVHLRDAAIAALERRGSADVLEAVLDDAQKIADLTSDNPRQTARVARLAEGARAAVALARRGDRWDDHGMHATLSDINDEEQTLMEKREREAGAAAARSGLATAGGGALTVLLVTVALFTVLRQRASINAARLEALDASRAKSDFLANMSHEIRTPLTALLGYADLLERTSLRPSEVRDHARTIRKNGEHLLALVNDVLDLSKVEAGAMAVALADCSPRDVLAEVTSALRVRATERGLTFEVSVRGTVPATMHTDRLRLKQILLNLVGNAIKFTERGSVRVVAMCAGPVDDARLVVDIVDTGIGIPERVQRRLFAPFTQGDASLRRRHDGAGLGLSISRKLARLLGGEIDVESAPGKGSTFRLTIPVGSVRDRGAVSELDAGKDTTNRRRAIEALQMKGSVLVADDGADNRRLLAAILGGAGLSVSLAEDGRAAVSMTLAALAAGTPYDVVLMDMQMPELDGLGATNELRAAGYARPIVALTAHAQPEFHERCLAAGCSAFLPKPIDARALLTVVQGLLGAPPDSGRRAVPSGALGPETIEEYIADDPALQAIAREFASSLVTRAAKLEEAMAAGDRPRLRFLAHTLKGEGGSFGFPEVTTAAREVERAADGGERDALERTVKGLARVCRSAAAA